MVHAGCEDRLDCVDLTRQVEQSLHSRQRHVNLFNARQGTPVSKLPLVTLVTVKSTLPAAASMF